MASVSIFYSKRLKKYIVASPIGGGPIGGFKQSWHYALDILSKQL